MSLNYPRSMHSIARHIYRVERSKAGTRCAPGLVACQDVLLKAAAVVTHARRAGPASDFDG